MRALAAGLGGALCLSQKPRAGEPAGADPTPPRPAEPAAGGAPLPAIDFGAMVKKNFTGRG